MHDNKDIGGVLRMVYFHVQGRLFGKGDLWMSHVYTVGRVLYAEEESGPEVLGLKPGPLRGTRGLLRTGSKEPWTLAGRQAALWGTRPGDTVVPRHTKPGRKPLSQPGGIQPEDRIFFNDPTSSLPHRLCSIRIGCVTWLGFHCPACVVCSTGCRRRVTSGIITAWGSTKKQTLKILRAKVWGQFTVEEWSSNLAVYQSCLRSLYS